MQGTEFPNFTFVMSHIFALFPTPLVTKKEQEQVGQEIAKAVGTNSKAERLKVLQAKLQIGYVITTRLIPCWHESCRGATTGTASATTTATKPTTTADFVEKVKGGGESCIGSERKALPRETLQGLPLLLNLLLMSNSIPTVTGGMQMCSNQSNGLPWVGSPSGGEYSGPSRLPESAGTILR